MKKKILIIVCMLFMMTFYGCGEKGTKGLEFELNEDGNSYTLTGYTGNKTKIEIPSTYKKLPVTCIGEGAFYKQTLTRVVIPNSVINIDESAFSNCKSLTSIIIPDSVTYIGSLAFGGCTSLTIYCETESEPSGWDINWNNYDRPVYYGVEDIIEQKGIQYLIIEENAVITRYVGKDSEVEIPDTIKYNNNTYNVTIIVEQAFSYSEITSVKISNSVICIDESAFIGCASLTSITIPDSITYIGSSAFSDCTSLTIYCESESQPSGWVRYWNSNRPVYYGVKEVIEQKGIQYLIIDGNAVVTRYVGRNSEVEIPSTITYNNNTYNVTEIGDYAFSYSEIISATIPNNVISIGLWAFEDCASLENATIPNSVESIGQFAFYNLNSRKKYHIQKNENITYISINFMLKLLVFDTFFIFFLLFSYVCAIIRYIHC